VFFRLSPILKKAFDEATRRRSLGFYFFGGDFCFSSDEIHRFNASQKDGFWPGCRGKGTVTLIGATHGKKKPRPSR